MTTPTRFDGLYSALQALRMKACMIYDRLVAQGTQAEAINPALAEVRQAYEEAINRGVQGDPDAVAYAIKAFGHERHKWVTLAKELLEKAEDSDRCADQLKEAMLAHMKATNQVAIVGERYTIELVQTDKVSRLVIR